MLADGRYFSTLRTPMELGRPLTEADDVPDAPLVVVLILGTNFIRPMRNNAKFTTGY